MSTTPPPRLVWSEARDLLDMTGRVDVAELIGALEAYRDYPQLPNETVDSTEYFRTLVLCSGAWDRTAATPNTARN